MSLQKPMHIWLFAFFLGSFAYLANALWSALFIVTLPVAEDAISETVRLETGPGRYDERPIAFKNTFEELKYYHNVRMRDRNRWWVYALLVGGGALGAFAFYTIPKWRGTLRPRAGITVHPAFEGVLLGCIVVLIVPLVCSWIFPRPASWFPKEVGAIAEMRREAALSELRVRANELDFHETEQ